MILKQNSTNFITSSIIFVIVLLLASCSSSVRFSSSKTSYRYKTESTKDAASEKSTIDKETIDGKVYQRGLASYYSDKFNGRKTANGEIFNNNMYTAAHKELPFGTEVRVINQNNRKSVNVKINDRGPFTEGRVIDLSKAAAEAIGMVSQGVVEVEIIILK